MTKKEIITALIKAKIVFNTKDTKYELESLLPANYAAITNKNAIAEKQTTIRKVSFICKQKGCHENNDAYDDNGHCSVCGHPLTE